MQTPFSFTTGPTSLPDIGTCSYNGVTFSPLFETSLSGDPVKDEAGRTTAYMDYTLTVDGYVTAPDGAIDTVSTMATLQERLTAQAGILVYRGRGCDLSVNSLGSQQKDVAWGPIPKLLEFQPLGGGLSAKVRWQVRVRISHIPINSRGNLLQLNNEVSITYNTDGYSTISLRGTMEIPLTRTPSQRDRTLGTTVDDQRRQLETRILTGLDMTRFHFNKRDFNISRDRRRMEWDIVMEEKAYMDFPPGCTLARGSYNVRPARAGMGLCTWLCTLRATYTVRRDWPRRTAWIMFLFLLRWRMLHSRFGLIPPPNGQQNPARPSFGAGFMQVITGLPPASSFEQPGTISRAVGNAITPNAAADSRKAWLIDFNIDEGLYKDSTTITFSATWRLVSLFNHILLASGIWSKVPEKDGQGSTYWATSMRFINGTNSWLNNKVDPTLDVIVDFGSTTV